MGILLISRLELVGLGVQKLITLLFNGPLSGNPTFYHSSDGYLINTSLAAPGALAHLLQRPTACQWAP